MRAHDAITVLGLALVAGLGCGELVDSGYRGEPRLELEGELTTRTDLPPVRNYDPTPRLAIFWLGDTRHGLLEEQRVTPRSDSPFATYEAVAWDTPPSPAVDGFGDLDVGAESIGVGVVVLYSDTDGDREWDLFAEDIVGGTYEYLLVHDPLAGETQTALRLAEPPSCDEGSSDDTPLLSGTPSKRSMNIPVVPPEEGLSPLQPDLNCDGQPDDPCFASIVAPGDRDAETIESEFRACRRRSD